MSSKELAYYISQYDYELFNAVNVVSTSPCLVTWQNAEKSPTHTLNRDSFGIYFTLNLPPLQSNLQHEFVYNIFGKENYNQITANLDLLLKRFNEVRHFRCSSHEVCWRQTKLQFLLAVPLTVWRILVFWIARVCCATSFRPMKELSRQSINRLTNRNTLFTQSKTA